MKGKNRAWLLLPIIIAVLVVIGLVVSRFQEEVGLMEPGRGEVAALAAAVSARDLSLGAGEDGYSGFSRALLAAVTARKNAGPGNAADMRMDTLLGEALDCLSAAREAWQAEIDQTWDPEVHGSPGYWNVLHPAMGLSQEGVLTSTEVRRAGNARATALLEQAQGLTD